MATSTLRPTFSDDERCLWYVCPPMTSAGAASAVPARVFTGVTFAAGVPLLIGATTAGTVVKFKDPASANTLHTVTIDIDGGTSELIPFAAVTEISISSPLGTTVCIVVRNESQTSSQPRLLTYTTTTNAPGLTGAGYVMAVGGGGGGSGGVTVNNWGGASVPAARTGAGGGTGGIAVGFINDLSTVNAITVGAQGNGGASVWTGANTATGGAGNAGGASTIGAVTANGGGGGQGPTITVNGQISNVANGGAAGTPGGAAGASGSGNMITAGDVGIFTPPTRGGVASLDSPFWGVVQIGSGGGGPFGDVVRPNIGSTVTNFIYSLGSSGNWRGDGFPNNATGFGAGGAGGGGFMNSRTSGNNFSGASGSPGVVFVMRGI